MPVDVSASLEVGLVGDEGMFGVPLVLGVDASPLRAVVQGAGSALRMEAAAFRRALDLVAELSGSAARLATRSLEPIHARATANARRLGRR